MDCLRVNRKMDIETRKEECRESEAWFDKERREAKKGKNEQHLYTWNKGCGRASCGELGVHIRVGRPKLG